MESLDDAVSGFVADLHASREPTSPCTPRQALVRGAWSRHRNAKARYGIMPGKRRLADTPHWRIPDNTNTAADGEIVNVPLTVTVVTEPHAAQPESLAVANDLVGRFVVQKQTTVTYAEVQFQRDPDRWLVAGERAVGDDWNWQRSCPHGLPHTVEVGIEDLSIGPVLLESFLTLRAANGWTHLIAIRNEGSRDVTVTAHAARAVDPRHTVVLTPEPLSGFPVPAGWELTLPVSVTTAERSRVFGIAPGDPIAGSIRNHTGYWTGLAVLPLQRPQGHPTSEYPCSDPLASIIRDLGGRARRGVLGIGAA